MTASLKLPTSSGSVETYRLSGTPLRPANPGPFNRVAYAAAHVVVDPLATPQPWRTSTIDWDATLAFRHHLWSLGFKVAEAMDTAQRGGGLDWLSARDLIRRSTAEARTVDGADLASGVGTDHLTADRSYSVDEARVAYEEQLEAVEAAGSRAIIMASRALVRAANSPDDYVRVYEAIIRQAAQPVILHWLGEMFDPALAGYWGSDTYEQQAAAVLSIIRAQSKQIDGIKISLLSAEREIALRRELPAGVRMYTGDDFNYAELIEGDGRHHSDALLGIFDPIAPAAAIGLTRLASGDHEGFRAVLEPTVPLSRRIFEAPTQYYKAGVVLLAWLNGFQDHFAMLGGMQSARGIVHYADVFRLADAAGLLTSPDLAVPRMRALCVLQGIEQ